MSGRLPVLQLGTCGPLYGAERWILALIRALDPAKVESHVAVIVDTPGAEAPLLDAAASLGVRVHAIHAEGRLSLPAVAQLRTLLREHGISVIHSHGYKPDAIALLARRGTTAKTLATPHGWSHGAGWKLAAYEAFDRALFARFDAVAPLSPGLFEELRRRPGLRSKLHFIPNGVDLEEIADAKKPPAELAALSQRGPLIGYAGQLIGRKDLATLLRAFARWGRADASLVLVGEGDARAALEAEATALGIGARTLFAGFRTDRLAWMQAFDAFVLPSRVEGIPRCLMEAMALGLPVIASGIAGTRELVRHGVTGLCFRPGEDAELASLFDRALGQSAMLGAAGRAHIEQRFSGAAMARAYEDLFARLAGN